MDEARKRTGRSRVSVAIALPAVVAILACLAFGSAEAEEAKAGLSTGGSLRDALARLGEGRVVELVLANGKSYKGKLGSIGDHSVILSEVAGREFYDALIVIDQISAIEVRARGN